MTGNGKWPGYLTPQRGTIREIQSEMELASLQNGLLRVSSKKFFRKWKPARICLFGDKLTVTTEEREPMVIPIDSMMRLSEVFEQKGGSLMESKTVVYFCRLVREAVGAIGETSKKSVIGPVSFLDDNDTETIIKLGCHSLTDLKRFAKALDKRLTTSPQWELSGRHRMGSKTETEEVRELQTRYRGSCSDLTAMSVETESKQEGMTISSCTVSAPSWHRFETDDPFDVL